MDIPVLTYVDVLIGLSLTMVLLSTIVLAVTQFILNASFARARHLKRGLIRLIVQLEPATMRPHADYLSRLFLRHPLIGQQTVLSPFRFAFQRIKLVSGGWIGDPTFHETVEIMPASSPGVVIQREELAYLMIELAAGEGALMDPADQGITPPRIAAARAALASALRLGGIEDPAVTLRAIRIKIVENERAEPDLKATRWRANAIADCAPSDFVGKLHASFDNTIARVTDAFSGESKLWASAVAFFLVVTLQVDSFALVKRLTLNEADRAAFVDAAQKLVDDRADLESTETTDPASVAAKTEALNSNQAARDELNESITLLNSPSLNLWPAGRLVNPLSAIAGREPSDVSNRWPGVLFTWVLVSLGAPFWFDLLKNLLKLRSLLAKQDEDERKKRQETTSEDAARKGAKGLQPADVVPISADEIGDLSATGAIG